VNGETYIGQSNDDFPAFFLDGKASVLNNIKQDNGPRILTYTYAGIPAMMGINSDGIGLCITGLLCATSRIGVPTMAIAREILNAKTIEDAIKAITRAKRAESANYLIAEKNGEIYDVEATPDDVDFFYADDYMVHTNHFLSRNLKIEKDVILAATPDTLIRKNRMTKLLKQHYGKLTEKILMNVYKDHVNYPNSICRHLDERIPRDYAMVTIDCMIFAPARKEMWIARENPCCNEFKKYTLE
jgi:isopenicillin-N N-acyltransferase-like protein